MIPFQLLLRLFPTIALFWRCHPSYLLFPVLSTGAFPFAICTSFFPSLVVCALSSLVCSCLCDPAPTFSSMFFPHTHFPGKFLLTHFPLSLPRTSLLLLDRNSICPKPLLLVHFPLIYSSAGGNDSFFIP